MDAMMRRAARVVSILVAATACDRAKDDHAASVRGPVDAHVTRACILQVDKPIPLQRTVNGPCTTYHLSADANGPRLAYAAPGDTWSIVYFGGGARTFPGLVHPAKGPLDWSKVPTLEETYADQLRAMIVRNDKSDLLFDEIVQKKGEAELARVLVETITSPAAEDIAAAHDETRSVWGRGFDRVKDKRAITAALNARLADLSLKDEGAAFAAARAALYGDIDAHDGKSLETADVQASWPAGRYAVAVLLARLAKRDDKRAATIACTLLDRTAPAKGTALNLTRKELLVALAVLGHAKEKCAAVDRIDEAWERAAPDSCTREEWRHAQQSAEAFITAAPATTRKLDVPIDASIVSAVLANGPSEARKKQLARQKYALDVPANAPECSKAKSGDKCQPVLTAQNQHLVCATDSDKTEGDVTIHFDDAHKRYWFTRT